MKSAMISDLIFLSALFRLVMYKFKEAMNFDLLSLLIETIVYFLEELLVVILILGLTFSESLIIL